MFNRMKIYTVHIKPGTTNAAEKPVFVRESFNLLAFVFTVFWALYHRLWMPAALIMGSNILVVMLSKMQVISPESTLILQIGIQVWVGLQANEWLRSGLSRRGYIMSDISTGDSLLRAEQRYFERYLAAG